MKSTNEVQYINYAKFLQNLLLEHNFTCYLVGGALINSIRDNGVFQSEDIDFAILHEGDSSVLEKALQIFRTNSPTFNYYINFATLTIYPSFDETKKIDFFAFRLRNVNYYLTDTTYIHEKIFHFQTFRTSEVTLENKNFITMYKPDLFLKTVYGDYSVIKSGYGAPDSGNTSHMKECNFYVDLENYDKVDYQVENLKTFFQKINVKRGIENIEIGKINIFDDIYINAVSKNDNLFYDDFIKFMFKNKIDYLKF